MRPSDARLLLTRDPVEAARLAGELDRLNGERQAIERAAVEEAQAQVLGRRARAWAGPFSSPPRPSGTRASSALSRRA